MDISNLKKVDGWYRGLEKEWEFKLYGFYPKGLGDLIYNNLRKIIETDDTSKWAQGIFDKCAVLLVQGKRWPDELDPSRVKGRKRYRSPWSMTRDPWVMFYAAAIHLDRRVFHVLKPQWWLWRPELWALRRALLRKSNNFKSFNKISNLFPMKDFVKVLDEYMKYSYDRRHVK